MYLETADLYVTLVFDDRAPAWRFATASSGDIWDIKSRKACRFAIVTWRRSKWTSERCHVKERPGRYGGDRGRTVGKEKESCQHSSDNLNGVARVS